jgi:hypothetical protein
VRIREFLKNYPEITLSIEEMGDFFIAALSLASAEASPPIDPPN